MPVFCSVCASGIAEEQKALAERAPGVYLCQACQVDPSLVVRQLLQLARSGDKDLAPLRVYEPLRELGRGGMGAVYLLSHEQTGERVALKVMLPQVAADQRSVDMFLREIEVTKALRHPNVVQLQDTGCALGIFFFTLEFCDGGSVDKLMGQRGGRMPPDEAVPIILQALDGLEYAHQVEVEVLDAAGQATRQRGLVHRDFKPHNIFLSSVGGSRVAKVGDFGLSKAFDLAGFSAKTKTGEVAGTLMFMPRQQVVNFKYARPEVDVWAAAASLYYLMTGHAPRNFPRGSNPYQVILGTDRVLIRQRQPSIPAKLAEVIDLALIDKPGIPFKTAAEFKQALESALG
jgi:serine/threonine protein kinase